MLLSPRKTLFAVVLLIAPLGDSCAQEIGPQAYSLHEWGVFTAPRDAEWLQLDMLREWQGFPEFFHGVLPERELNYRGPVTKPVIFFHGAAELQIDLSIQFAQGYPMIWWPPAEYPADGAWWHSWPAEFGEPRPESLLRFSLKLNTDDGTHQSVPADHWLNHLRKVDAARFTVEGSYGMRGPAEQKASESFIYYDGLMERPPIPTVTRTEDGIRVVTESDHDWMEVIAIERNFSGEPVACARHDRITSGRQTTQLKWQSIDQSGIERLAAQLKRNLVDQGLNQDEAESLLSVWYDGMFMRSGITLMYRVPRETYDRWIPLVASPPPAQTVRAGLVVHHHLEPELDDRVVELIDQLGSAEFAIRDRAHRRLLEIGGAALSVIQDARGGSDIERAARAEKIINDLDTDAMLKKAVERLEQLTRRR